MSSEVDWVFPEGDYYEKPLELPPLARFTSARVTCSACGGNEQVKPSGRCSNCDRDAYLLKVYKITAAEYEALLESQGGVCAICKKDPYKPAVDHDHACCPGRGGEDNPTCGGCVRGILCQRCNQALGLLRDDANIAARAAEYLRVTGGR